VWERLCDALGKPEWKEKPEWNTSAKRSADRKALNAAIAEITRHKPSAYWVERLEEAGVPCGPINTIDQVFADPQVQHLGIASPVTSRKGGDMKLVASPINVEGVSKKIRLPTADAGQHTDEILRSVGYSDAQVAAMRAKGVI
jgi:formyl-CoA transferase